MTAYQERNYPLNPQQRAAAESDARVTLVVGGAGTGKTQAAVARVAHLIGQGHEPRTIACLTTGGKVDLLNRRLEGHDLVERRTLEVFVGDPASLANFFLRREGAEAVKWPANYSLWPQRRCIDETLARVTELGWSDEAKKEVRPALAWHWSNRALDENESRQRKPEALWAEILRVYREVTRDQEAWSPSDVLVLATQFMDMVRNGQRSVEDFPETAGRFRHLVVDQGEDVTREESGFC